MRDQLKVSGLARARGRWFKPVDIELTEYISGENQPAIALNIFSKRRGQLAPIILELTPESLLDLTEKLWDFMDKSKAFKLPILDPDERPMPGPMEVDL